MALCVQSEQRIPKGVRRNGEAFHIADFVLTVMVSGRVGTDYSPAPSAMVHTNYSQLVGEGVTHEPESKGREAGQAEDR